MIKSMKLLSIAALFLLSSTANALCIPLYPTAQAKIECYNSCMLRFVNCKIENYSNPDVCQAAYTSCSAQCERCIPWVFRPLGALESGSGIQASPSCGTESAAPVSAVVNGPLRLAAG